MQIRPMTTRDASAVALLNREMQYHSSAEQIATRFERLATQPDDALFVAETAGNVVGWAHVRVVHLLHTDAYAALLGLAVRLDARRQRIGVQLIAACRAWAQARGHDDVRLP